MKADAGPIRVLVVDDEPLARKGIRMRLADEPDVEVVGEAEDGRAGVRLTEELHPDIVVMDIAMKSLNGIEATRQIRQRFPRTQVIMLSMHLLESYVRQALESGAAGYLLKSAAGSELIAALENVRTGGSYFSAPVSRMIVEGYLETNRAAKAEKVSVLTPREREVLQLIAEGNNTRQVAVRLGVSPKTAESHRLRITKKLAIKDTAGLVRYAIRHGLSPL